MKRIDLQRMVEHPWARTIGLVSLGAILVGVVFGRDLASYATTWLARSRDQAVSVQFELERARQMVGDLLPEIHTAMLAVAEDELTLERSNTEVAEVEAQLNVQRSDLMRLRANPENEAGVFKVGSRKATPGEVREELKRRFGRYQTGEATLDVKRQIAAARKQSLVETRKKLQELLNARQDLESQIEQLDARLRHQELARQNTNLDPGQIVRCQVLLDGIRRRLDVADRMVAAKIPLEDVLLTSYLDADTDIGKEIDEYFREPSKSRSGQ
jgi:hypothetical protein